MQAIILASSSVYRKQLLQRLGLQFSVVSPEIDETPLAAETTAEMVKRLSIEKAGAVALEHTTALIIGSDQAAEFDGKALGKPGSVERAIDQLECLSGRVVEFFTAVSLQQPDQSNARVHLDCTRVHFRPLTRQEIERYIAAESPLDCAGSFKSEGLGISLFERIETDDPSALIGLPLIGLAGLLRGAGVELP